MHLWVMYEAKSLASTVEDLIDVLCKATAKINCNSKGLQWC